MSNRCFHLSTDANNRLIVILAKICKTIEITSSADSDRSAQSKELTRRSIRFSITNEIRSSTDTVRIYCHRFVSINFHVIDVDIWPIAQTLIDTYRYFTSDRQTFRHALHNCSSTAFLAFHRSTPFVVDASMTCHSTQFNFICVRPIDLDE
jgi:hypothetical protein